MAVSKLMFVAVVMFIATLQLPSAVAQTRHVVGDTFGWNVPTDGNATYTNWASRQIFTVGDILVFNFATGVHDVAEVRQAAFGPCTTTNPISRNPTGPATITLTAPGNHYYICTFGVHCSSGQKLSINVRAASGAPAPGGSATPAPAGSTTPPPPPSSGASSFTAVVPFTILMAGLALFY